MAPIITNDNAYSNSTVSVAPLVLLSAVDHYERVAKTSNSSVINKNKRVAGVILGENINDKLFKVTNSFAIPFEEDEKNPNIWFLDHNYIESMLEMFKKINAKEKFIGWYHTGPKLRPSDLQVNEIFKRFTPNPLLLIVDVNSDDEIDIPTDSYIALEEIKEDGSSSEKTFVHLPSIIQAEEAEEIGVEHLLRDIRDQACGNLSIRLTNNFKSLKSLNERLTNIIAYLNRIISKELPINNAILEKLQDIFNLLPNINGLASPESLVPGKTQQLDTAFNVKTNDELVILYVSNLVRSIIAFHDLIDNKIGNKNLNDSANKKPEEETTDEDTQKKEDASKDDSTKTKK